MTTSPRSKKATAKKARAILGLLDQPGARLILMGKEHVYVLAGREHVYLCCGLFDFLRAQQWISPPVQLEGGIMECTCTKEGHVMLNRWRNANGAGYTQLLFEEIQEFIETEAQQQTRTAGYQQSLFKEE